MRFGVCTGVENIGLVKSAGYDYIELNFTQITQMSDEEFEALKEMVLTSGILAETYNCFFPGDIKLCGDEADLDLIAKYAEKGFSRAAQLGGKIAVIGSGGSRRIPEGFDRRTAMVQLVAVLRVCGDAAEKHGMKVAVEPLRAKETNVINTVAEGLELCKKAAHPAVGCLADFFHVYAGGEGYESIKNAGEMLIHTHLARARDDRRIPTSEDREDCRNMAEALKACGYTGRMSLEGSYEPDFETAIKAVKPVLNLFR